MIHGGDVALKFRQQGKRRKPPSAQSQNVIRLSRQDAIQLVNALDDETIERPSLDRLKAAVERYHAKK